MCPSRMEGPPFDEKQGYVVLAMGARVEPEGVHDALEVGSFAHARLERPERMRVRRFGQQLQDAVRHEEHAPSGRERHFAARVLRLGEEPERATRALQYLYVVSLADERERILSGAAEAEKMRAQVEDSVEHG